MKLRWITGLLMAGAMAILAAAQSDNPQAPAIGGLTLTEPSNDTNSTVQSPDPLSGYEDQMAAVTVQAYQEMAQIAEALHAGQISSDEAAHLTRHSFELSMVRLQFLDTMHQIVATTLSKQALPTKLEEQPSLVHTSEQTLVVAPPTSSPDISESMAKYLELTPTQIAAIQARITQEQKQVQPLLQHLSENRKALAAVPENGSSNSEIQKLAIEQSRILKQLIIANSRLQRDIYEILTAAQRKRLNDMGQDAADPTMNPFAHR